MLVKKYKIIEDGCNKGFADSNKEGIDEIVVTTKHDDWKGMLESVSKEMSDRRKDG